MRAPETEHVTAVGTSIDVEVHPDPASCSLTAAQLAVLAEACERTRALLVSHARLSEEQFGGMSGIVYRHSSVVLARATERIGGRSIRLAEGLASYAEGMTEVQRLMDDAIACAAPHLTISGGRIWRPPEPTRTDDTLLAQAWAAWYAAKSRWHAARDLELRTSQDWVGLLGRAVTVDDGEPPMLDLDLDLDRDLDGAVR